MTGSDWVLDKNTSLLLEMYKRNSSTGGTYNMLPFENKANIIIVIVVLRLKELFIKNVF